MSSQYTKGLKRIVSNEISLLTDNLKFVLVDKDNYTVNYDEDEFLSDIPALARVSISPNISGKLFAIDDLQTPPQVYFVCNNVVFQAVTGNQFESVVLFKDSGDPSTSPLVSYYESSNTTLTPTGDDITLEVSVTGILRWAR
jgi:hypothetical protein